MTPAVSDPAAAKPTARSASVQRLRLANWPTGAKLFAILSLALLPLALFTILAAYQTTRNAAEDNRARLRVVTAEASRTLMIELTGDMAALKAALRAIGADPDDAPSCARLRGVFAQANAEGAAFAVIDRAGALKCGSPLAGLERPRDDGVSSTIGSDGGLVLSIAGKDGSVAGARFPARLLAAAAKPANAGDTFTASLRLPDGRAIALHESTIATLASRDRLMTPLGIGGLTLQTELKAAPITVSVLATMLAPVLMWLAAAGLSWLLVDALMLRSLRQLRRSVVTYRPGTVLEALPAKSLSAREIADLDEAFRDLSARLTEHEREVAEGMSRQTRLTREVHHRVKNNLQVIASLINLHARGASNDEVINAYASIQRRVDALAVVHRHHFAELEASEGLSLRAVISELSANIRATAPERIGHIPIALEVEPLLVSQDTGIAIAFLLTELIELAVTLGPGILIRISAAAESGGERGLLRLSSPALLESEALTELMQSRYGRVIEGLARQLRSKLHYDPLVGAFEVSLLILGRA